MVYEGDTSDLTVGDKDGFICYFCSCMHVFDQSSSGSVFVRGSMTTENAVAAERRRCLNSIKEVFDYANCSGMYKINSVSVDSDPFYTDIKDAIERRI